jgi:hypothetical protein
MDLHRFNIAPHVFVFETQKHLVSVAYSLEFAFSSLRSSLALRTGGDLWKTKEVQAASSAPIRRDPWYLEMSEHLLTKKGADTFGKYPGRLSHWELQQELFPLDDETLGPSFRRASRRNVQTIA